MPVGPQTKTGFEPINGAVNNFNHSTNVLMRNDFPVPASPLIKICNGF